MAESKRSRAAMMVVACLVLGYSMVAVVHAQATVRYVHTDSLGSVVATTDQNRVVVERRIYEPYGLQLTPAIADGPGYTGHVQDTATGLTYMQQRYQDPAIGKFLSVDPVAVRPMGDNFNRFAYAANNPYKFTDPDGREVAFTAQSEDSEFPELARSQWREAKENAPPTVRARMEQLERSENMHEFRPLSEGKYRQAYNEATNPENESSGVGTGTVTYYDPKHSFRSGGQLVTPVEVLVHEGAGHAADKDSGSQPSRSETDPTTGNTLSEQSAMDIQNEYRTSNGRDEIKRH